MASLPFGFTETVTPDTVRVAGLGLMSKWHALLPSRSIMGSAKAVVLVGIACGAPKGQAVAAARQALPSFLWTGRPGTQTQPLPASTPHGHAWAHASTRARPLRVWLVMSYNRTPAVVWGTRV